MKVRIDFITNSSSTAYIIKNISDETKTIVDFVKENLDVLRHFNVEYEYSFCPEDLIKSAESLLTGANISLGYDPNDSESFVRTDSQEEYEERYKNLYTWKPKERKVIGFGDEQRTTIGLVFDYGLRDGGKSESFEYCFYEYWR
jgi:hypothetical protein